MWSMPSPRTNGPRGRKSGQPEDLSKHTVMVHSDMPMIFDSWREAGSPALKPAAIDHIDSGPLMLEAAANGLGVAIMHGSHFSDARDPRLTRLFDMEVESPYSYWFVCRPRALKQRAVKIFHDWLLKRGFDKKGAGKSDPLSWLTFKRKSLAALAGLRALAGELYVDLLAAPESEFSPSADFIGPAGSASVAGAAAAPAAGVAAAGAVTRTAVAALSPTRMSAASFLPRKSTYKMRVVGTAIGAAGGDCRRHFDWRGGGGGGVGTGSFAIGGGFGFVACR